ncbi:MAG: class I SAM-dependent methyltransferase [Burkholderiales bacterium]|nr:class I SAM-dependent methyltransferase [Burkholderiales bacterium]
MAEQENALVRWEARFSVGEYLFGEKPNAYLASKASLLAKGSRALSIADGEGRNSVWLAEQGLRVDAFDFSPTAVAKAERLALKRGTHVRFNVSETFAWSWEPSTYDLVAAIFIQFASPAVRARLFPLIKQTLKPGGLLILQGYRTEQLLNGTGGPPEADHLYTEPMIREALADMDIIELRCYDEHVDEGKGHAGMSALMGLVARKR